MGNHSVLDEVTSGYTEGVHQAMKSQNLQSERHNEGIWKRVKIITFWCLFTALWVRSNNVIFFYAKGKINFPSLLCFQQIGF